MSESQMQSKTCKVDAISIATEVEIQKVPKSEITQITWNWPWHAQKWSTTENPFSTQTQYFENLKLRVLRTDT
jgi:hypothetical protein